MKTLEDTRRYQEPGHPSATPVSPNRLSQLFVSEEKSLIAKAVGEKLI